MTNHTLRSDGSGPAPLGRSILAVYAGMTLFAMPVTVSSILIAELSSQLAYTTGFSGLLVFAQFLGMIIGGLLASRVATNLPTARLAAGLLIASATLEALSASLLDHPLLFIAGRLGIGLGVGAVYTLVLSIVGASGQAEKVFGLATTLCMVSLAAITGAAGFVYSEFGVRAGILFIACTSLIFLAPLSRTPPRSVPTTKPASMQPGSNKSLGLFMSLGFLLGKMALGLGSAFVILAANSKGIDTRLASTLVGLALLTGMGGSTISAFAAGALGRITGTAIGLAGAALGWLLLYGQPLLLPTLAAMFIYPFFSAFYATFMLGTANALDSGGRWTALVSPLTSAGMALGALTGGYFLSVFTLPGLALLLTGLLATSLACFALVEKRLQHEPGNH